MRLVPTIPITFPSQMYPVADPKFRVGPLKESWFALAIAPVDTVRVLEPVMTEGVVWLTLWTSDRIVTGEFTGAGLPTIALLVTSPNIPLNGSPLKTWVKFVEDVVSSAMRPLALYVYRVLAF